MVEKRFRKVAGSFIEGFMVFQWFSEGFMGTGALGEFLENILKSQGEEMVG